MRRKAKRKSAAPKKGQPIPKDYNVVIPYLAIRGAAQAIEFYKKVFGAKEMMRMPGPPACFAFAAVASTSFT